MSRDGWPVAMRSTMEAMPDSETAEPAAVSTTCSSVALPPRGVLARHRRAAVVQPAPSEHDDRRHRILYQRVIQPESSQIFVYVWVVRPLFVLVDLVSTNFQQASVFLEGGLVLSLRSRNPNQTSSMNTSSLRLRLMCIATPLRCPTQRTIR